MLNRIPIPAFLLMAAALNFQLKLHAQPDLDLNQFATGFTRPVDITNAGDDRLFIVEQTGVIRIADLDGNVLPTPFLDIRAQVNDAGNEQGLLGLAFPPDFSSRPVFYVNYTTGNGSGRTIVSRFAIDAGDPNLADPASEEVLLDFIQPFTNHNGGDLNFGPDGNLYIAVGDGGSGGDPQNNGQSKTKLLGKILRIDVSGETGYAIPPDNPFAGHATFAEEIWSLGLRNPWRFSFDRKTGDMWIGDVGQGSREEVDFEPAGAAGGINYGWRCYEGSQAFDNTGCNEEYTFPIFSYPHNNSTGGFSITGGFVYRGLEMPQLRGTYVFCDYVTDNFWVTSRVDNSGEWQTFISDVLSGISTFGEDSNGEIYAGRLSTGIIYKLSATCPGNPFTVTISESGDSLLADIAAGQFQWTLDGDTIEGATGSSIVPVEDGDYAVEVIINDKGCHYDTVSNTINYMAPVGIYESVSGRLKFYPNPASETLLVDLGSLKEKDVLSWQLVNSLGAEARAGVTFTGDALVIDTGDLARGYYYFKLQTSDGILSGRFMVR